MEGYLLLVLCISVSGVYSDSWEPPADCMMSHKEGNCFAKIQSYFYNKNTGECEEFFFSGCGGNNNRFRTKSQCIKHCSCHMPLQPGTCKASMTKWYYNTEKGCCEKFTYGGCGGNGNNFDTYNECKEMCAFTSSGPVKPLGANWGSGNLLSFRLSGMKRDQPQTQNFGGAKTIWLHNEDINSNVMSPGTKEIMRLFSKSRKTQVPGVQTRSQLKLISANPRLEDGGLQRIGGRRVVISGREGMVPAGRNIQTGGRRVVISGREGMVPAGGNMQTGGRRVMISGREGMVPAGGNMQTGATGRIVLRKQGGLIGDSTEFGGAAPVGGSGGMFSTRISGRSDTIPSGNALGIRTSEIMSRGGSNMHPSMGGGRTSLGGTISGRSSLTRGGAPSMLGSGLTGGVSGSSRLVSGSASPWGSQGGNSIMSGSKFESRPPTGGNLRSMSGRISGMPGMARSSAGATSGGQGFATRSNVNPYALSQDGFQSNPAMSQDMLNMDQVGGKLGSFGRGGLIDGGPGMSNNIMDGQHLNNGGGWHNPM